MMATRKRRIGNRSLIAIGITLFLLIAFVVVWRRSTGVSNARKIARMEARRAELQTEKQTLERQIADAVSYGRIVQAARKLDMHVAGEREVRTIERDPRMALDSAERQ